MSRAAAENTIRPRGLNATNIPKLKHASSFANHSWDSVPRIKVTMAETRKETEGRRVSRARVAFAAASLVRCPTHRPSRPAPCPPPLSLSLSLSGCPPALPYILRESATRDRARKVFSLMCRRYESDRVGSARVRAPSYGCAILRGNCGDSPRPKAANISYLLSGLSSFILIRL
jgi:hypothetical protein